MVTHRNSSKFMVCDRFGSTPTLVGTNPNWLQTVNSDEFRFMKTSLHKNFASNFILFFGFNILYLLEETIFLFLGINHDQLQWIRMKYDTRFSYIVLGVGFHKSESTLTDRKIIKQKNKLKYLNQLLPSPPKQKKKEKKRKKSKTSRPWSALCRPAMRSFTQYT